MNEICGNDENRFHFSALKWSDGTGVNFVQWARGQSDALLGLMNCAEVLTQSGDMGHQRCSQRRNWVCSITKGTHASLLHFL